VSKMELNIGKFKTHGVKAGEIMVISKCLEELMNVMLNQEELQQDYGAFFNRTKGEQSYSFGLIQGVFIS